MRSESVGAVRSSSCEAARAITIPSLMACHRVDPGHPDGLTGRVQSGDVPELAEGDYWFACRLALRPAIASPPGDLAYPVLGHQRLAAGL
jgi:hypothetical protein